MDVVNDILLDSLLIFLWGGSIVGILIGAGMLVMPERTAHLNRYFSRWIHTDKIGRELDRPRWIERFFYRHHRVVGGIIFLGAIVVLYAFLFGRNVRKLPSLAPAETLWLLDAMVGMFIIGSVLAAAVGAIMLLKPSILRDFEKSANRWISTDGWVKFFNNMYYPIDEYILRHRKMMGVALITFGIYVLLILGYFLFRDGWKF